MVLKDEAQKRLEIIQKTPLFKESLEVVLDNMLDKALNNLLTGSGEHIFRSQGYYKAVSELKSMINVRSKG